MTAPLVDSEAGQRRGPRGTALHHLLLTFRDNAHEVLLHSRSGPPAAILAFWQAVCSYGSEPSFSAFQALLVDANGAQHTKQLSSYAIERLFQLPIDVVITQARAADRIAATTRELVEGIRAIGHTEKDGNS